VVELEEGRRKKIKGVEVAANFFRLQKTEP
jgi:hypothetical protein